MPLPSSWNVLRAEPCSSVCSLPDDAMLLWGERGAWSVETKFCRLPPSSWLPQSEPQAWRLEASVDFFTGLGCICPPRPGPGRKTVEILRSSTNKLCCFLSVGNVTCVIAVDRGRHSAEKRHMSVLARWRRAGRRGLFIPGISRIQGLSRTVPLVRTLVRVVRARGGPWCITARQMIFQVAQPHGQRGAVV